MSFIRLLRDVVADGPMPIYRQSNQPPLGSGSRRRSFSDEEDDEENETDPRADNDDQSESIIITAADLRPDITSVNAMSIALQELSTCKGMFDKWAQELDRSGPVKKDELEDDLFAAVDELRDQAALALEASATIVRDHETFATEMVNLLELSVSSPNGDVYRPTEVMAAGDNIMDQSDKLQLHSRQMQEQLDFVLELVNSVRRKTERKLLWKKIYKWLIRAFEVLSAVLSVGAFVLPMMIPIGDTSKTVISVGASLAGGAASLCKRLQMSDDEELKFSKMLEFLKVQVPLEAARASKSLQVFQACHRVLQVDIKFQQGEVIRMTHVDAETARNEWRAHRQALQQVNTAFQRSRDGYNY